VTPILQRRLILVIGKGGVGRSTVAASIAAATAREGRRTLLFEANAKDRFGDFFGRPAVGTEICKLRENLYAVNTTPDAALEEYGLMILRFRRVYKMVFENRITEAFLKAIPGIEEYAVLGKAWYHTKETKRGEPVWDTLVFDMAASGHSLSMLRIPWAIGDAVPDGPLTRDAREVQSLLLDPDRTSVVMVTLAEDMPSNEAIELTTDLKHHLKLDVSKLIVNQLYADRFPKNSPQEQILSRLGQEPWDDRQDGKELASLTAAAMQCQSRRHLNEEHLARLEQALGLPAIQLPRLFVPVLTATEIDFFTQHLAQELC
jgi:anion-transporting  ArsA/GET3 family ATPase